MQATDDRPGERWGTWEFDPGALSLSLQATGYRISLKDIKSSACMLDYIFELNAKPWATNEITRNLLNAFQDLFDPRMTLCSAPGSGAVNPEAILAERGRRSGQNARKM